MSSISQLIAQYELDREQRGANGSAAGLRLSRVLDSIGWRSASDVPAEEVAGELAPIVGACVHGHRDLATLRRAMAECLRQHAHLLDGSASARAEWEPAAAQIIELYARGGVSAERG